MARLGIPLVVASAMRGNVSMVSEAVADGCSVDALGNYGETALHWAVMRGDEAMVDGLMALGADPSVRDVTGMTPADLAPGFGHLPLARKIRGWTRCAKSSTSR